MTITLIFGPPGTGKTTRLLDEAERSGLPPERIAFLAFTRRAAREARERAVERFGWTNDQLRHWRTIHSTGARQAGLRPDELMTGQHWDRLGEILGMRFGKPDEAGRVVTRLDERGARLQQAYQTARAQNHTGLLGNAIIPEPWPKIQQFERALRDYKFEYGLLDFPDLIQHPQPLDVSLVLIDEGQDLTPAQWRAADTFAAHARDVYIAGDDDQAIYGWGGADVNGFLLHPAEHREVLPISHRLPRLIAELAEWLSSRIRHREPKGWLSQERCGDVLRITSPTEVLPDDGTWLLLARGRYQLQTWETLCRLHGIPYETHGIPAVKPAEVRAIQAWEAYRAGKSVPVEAMNPAWGLARMARNKVHDPAVAQVTATGPGAAALPIWHRALSGIPKARRLFYEACLRRDPRSLTQRPQVQVSTIHGAKGAEADHVALLTDLPARAQHGLSIDPDAEHRVWYVAATRARQTLTLVHPLTNRRYPM